ncbi:MAG: hypothetical protein ACRD9Y_25665 [Blastocatellia bacterium]
MLRITIHKDAAATRFALEGKLIGEWVSELEQCWLQAAAASPPRIRVELNDVSFVDEAGQELLARMAANGAELSAADVLTKALVEEILTGSFQRQ